ncbi:protein disulfide isomerase [Mycena metata]|uniref:Protein disulfide isomerase n=1 Tax=Mycena metata TaxID=1033252 RepID=A0AAD7HLL4_9AGAR|nr:protein disulfide isomerase [Mycena metata]
MLLSMLGALRELPVSVLLTSFALASAALPVETAGLPPSLTPDNFKTTIAKGVWFVEHFSPYCSHCRAFEPTWIQLVEQSENSAGVRLAQVDCSVNGDLCDANGIKGYPTLNLYRDGDFVEKFKGNRDFDVLTEYLAKNALPPRAPEAPPPPPLPPSKPGALLNPSGEVAVLDPDNFHATIEQGGTFVKFYAPWCGHCKKLAPVWKQLAKAMTGKVTIAEVNCEAHEKLCKSQDVGGYPMLVYYPPGAPKAEYTMGRKLEQLKSFAEKASASATQPIQPAEVDAYVSDSPAIYLLLYPAGESHLVKTVSRLAAPLLGSPLIYTSDSPVLFKRYAVPSSAPWVVIALKDHNPHTAAAMFIGGPTAGADLTTWLLENRLPTSLELMQETFQSVMNAPHSPLVVIAAVTKDTQEKVAERFRDVALKWRVHTGGTGVFAGRAVVFTWMDADKWESWLKSMYGLRKSHGDDIEDVQVVIADHKVLKYYDSEPDGDRIKLTSPSIFSALEGAASGSIPHKESENFVERMARYLNAKMGATEAYVVAHPLHAVFMLGLVVVVVYLGMRRCLSDDLSRDREYGYSKSGRMD